jgi:hypothetical protein
MKFIVVLFTMKIKYVALGLSLWLMLACGQPAASSEASSRKNDTVLLPDEAAAIKFAEQILFKHYGQQHIESQRPYGIEKSGSNWIITGTLNPKFNKGGTFSIAVDASDGHVIDMGHTK